MDQLSSFTVPVDVDGRAIHIEVSASGREKVAKDFKYKFEDALPAIEAVARKVGTMLAAIAPDEATVEMGIELSVESGALTAVLVKGEGKANLNISLTWKKPESASK